MKSSTVKNTLVVGFLYNVALNGFLYIGQIGIVRSLSRVEYAQFIVATNFIALFSLIIDLGLTSLTVKLISEAQFQQSDAAMNPLGRTFGTLLLFRIILSILVVGVVEVSAHILGYSDNTVLLMTIFLPSLFISSRLFALRSIGEAFLRGVGKYRQYIRYATIDALCFSLCVFIAGIYKTNVVEIMLIYTLSNLPGFLLLSKAIYSDLKKENILLQFDSSIIKKLLVKGSPLIIGSVCLAVHNAADPLILDKLSTPNEVSAFGASLRVQTALMFLPIIFSTVIAPEVTRYLSAMNIDYARNLVHRSIKALLVFSCGIALIVTTLPNTIVSVLFGDGKYTDISPLIQLFSWTFVGISYSLFIIEIAVVEGKQWITMVYMVVSMAVSVALDIALIPSHGAYGAALARFIAITLATIIVSVLTRNMSTIDPKIHRHILFRIGLCIASSFFIYFICTVNELQNTITTGTTMLIYLSTVYFAKLFHLSDIRSLFVLRRADK
jgi:O-antigen/teichoic acid export membrane protein